MFRCMTVAAAALLLLATDASAQFTSRYASIREIYEYGNFCGPRLPRFEGVTRFTPQAIEALMSLPAQDSIDQACKIHDVCYEVFGDDNYFCDRALVNYLSIGEPPGWGDGIQIGRAWEVRGLSSGEQRRRALQCTNLAAEIVGGMMVKDRVRHAPRGGGSNRILGLFVAGITAPTAAVNNAVGSFPPQSGQCRLEQRAIEREGDASAGSILLAALAERNGCRWRMVRGALQEVPNSCVSDQRGLEATMETIPLIDRLYGRAVLISVYPVRDLRTFGYLD